jgi:hypothetical protein
VIRVTASPPTCSARNKAAMFAGVSLSVSLSQAEGFVFFSDGEVYQSLSQKAT